MHWGSRILYDVHVSIDAYTYIYIYMYTYYIHIYMCVHMCACLYLPLCICFAHVCLCGSCLNLHTSEVPFAATTSRPLQTSARIAAPLERPRRGEAGFPGNIAEIPRSAFKILSINPRMRYAYTCMFVHMCAKALHVCMHIHTYTYAGVCMYIYICIEVCACLYINIGR